jgi:osmoprotectant transport system substrate-binding protein
VRESIEPGSEKEELMSRTTWRAGVAGVAGLLCALLVLTVGSAAGAGMAPAGALTPTATTISLGTKDFTEEFVLGQLYKQALEHKGITVDYHENIGSTEVIQTALRSGKIDAYPEYVGEIVQTAYHVTKLPKTAHAWWALAKSLLAKDGYALTNATPFYDVDAIAVRKTDAKKYHLKTLWDLKRLQNSSQRPKNFSIGARPEFKNREEGYLGMKHVYGLTKLKYVSLALGLTYKALDQKKVFCVNVFSTDAQLASGKYTVLKDPKLIFGVQNVAVIVKQNVATPQVVSILNAVSAKLTLPAILAMNKATQLNKQNPADVAKKFLAANGL